MLLEIVLDFVNNLSKKMNRSIAISSTKRALKRQLSKHGIVIFEVDNVRYEFTKQEVVSIWNEIK